MNKNVLANVAYYLLLHYFVITDAAVKQVTLNLAVMDKINIANTGCTQNILL